MTQYETVAIPFKQFGNRRGLTEKQIAEHDYIREFVKRFPNSFEYVPAWHVYLFIEPDSK